MFSWYKSASACLAYLDDMDSTGCITAPQIKSQLSRCRWFTRGWTLQELIAPRTVYFLDFQWRCFGVKQASNILALTLRPPSLTTIITAITGIDGNVLDGILPTSAYSVAQRLSWASKRATSRIEDVAYCLLGLFDVNMPLLYGEGTYAFQRLQHEILLRLRDDSIYAWSHDNLHDPDLDEASVLAPSPAKFAWANGVVQRSIFVEPIIVFEGTGWRLIHTSSPPCSVFQHAVDGTLLVVRLRCTLRSRAPGRASHCIVILKREPCGHFIRVFDRDLVGSQHYRPRPTHTGDQARPWLMEPLDEESVENASAWRPFTGPSTTYVHKTAADARACIGLSVWSIAAFEDLSLRLGQVDLEQRPEHM